MTDTEVELARLRLTVAKVRGVYQAIRTLEAYYKAPGHIDTKLSLVLRGSANAIEDALIDGDYEAA